MLPHELFVKLMKEIILNTGVNNTLPNVKLQNILFLQIYFIMHLFFAGILYLKLNVSFVSSLALPHFL